MNLDRPRARVREYPEATWINALEPPTLAALRGRAALIYLWNYTEPASLRPLPYLRAWHERYSESGVEFVGVHIPTFRFAEHPALVRSAVGRLGIRWPVMLDPEARYASHLGGPGRPGVVLVGPDTTLRDAWWRRIPFEAVELALQSIIRETRPSDSLPAPLPPIRPEDASEADLAPCTPDLGAADLGNPFPPSPVPTILEAPAALQDGRFYLEGLWRAAPDGFTLAGVRGRVRLAYHAAAVYAVLSPTPDPVGAALDVIDPVEVHLTQDSEPLSKDHFAEDTYEAEDGARVRVDTPRLFCLARNADAQKHELCLEALGPGLTLHSFCFEPGLRSGGAVPAHHTE
jgi:hypothetical protein